MTENKNLYYLDEEWVNRGHSVASVWKDKIIKIARAAFLQGCSIISHKI